MFPHKRSYRIRRMIYRVLFWAPLVALLVTLSVIVFTRATGDDSQTVLRKHLRKPPVNPYWVEATGEVDRTVAEMLTQRKAELQRGLKYHIVMRGNPKLKEVALTFDDGPHPFYTLQILDVLRKSHVKATFFLVGEKALQCPDIVRMELAEGHEVANHTFHHVNLTKIPPERVAVEIKACGDALKSITGKAPRYFRPPGGQYNTFTAETAEALGYNIILWTDDPKDYARPSETVEAQRLDRHISPGGIILVHDGVQQTIDILPDLIIRLQREGYRFVPLSRLIADTAAHL